MSRTILVEQLEGKEQSYFNDIRRLLAENPASEGHEIQFEISTDLEESGDVFVRIVVYRVEGNVRYFRVSLPKYNLIDLPKILKYLQNTGASELAIASGYKDLMDNIDRLQTNYLRIVKRLSNDPFRGS